MCLWLLLCCDRLHCHLQLNSKPCALTWYRLSYRLNVSVCLHWSRSPRKTRRCCHWRASFARNFPSHLTTAPTSGSRLSAGGRSLTKAINCDHLLTPHLGIVSLCRTSLSSFSGTTPLLIEWSLSSVAFHVPHLRISVAIFTRFLKNLWFWGTFRFDITIDGECWWVKECRRCFFGKLGLVCWWRKAGGIAAWNPGSTDSGRA